MTDLDRPVQAGAVFTAALSVQHKPGLRFGTVADWVELVSRFGVPADMPMTGTTSARGRLRKLGVDAGGTPAVLGESDVANAARELARTQMLTPGELQAAEIPPANVARAIECAHTIMNDGAHLGSPQSAARQILTALLGVEIAP